MNRRLAGLLMMALSAVFLTAGFALLFSAPPGVVAHAEPLNQREPFTDTACLDCHTDQGRLEELTASKADEPEEASLSSGPG